MGYVELFLYSYFFPLQSQLHMLMTDLQYAAASLMVFMLVLGLLLGAAFSYVWVLSL